MTEYTVTIESCAELLRTIAPVLDIRTVFPQVSRIANNMIAHDLLTMLFHDGTRNIFIEAASTDALRGCTRFTTAKDSLEGGFMIVEDFATATWAITEPLDLNDRIVAAGFRSLLVVATCARQQAISLAFWSKRPHAFSVEHVPLARHVADYVALSVSHE